MPQGICKKYGRFRVIFDLSMQTYPDEVVLNHETSTNYKAIIDFGKAKMNLLINIYNWQVSYPREMIYLVLADITACFRFPRIFADVVGAFGYVAEGNYFVLTSHVFSSNTLASSWELFQQAIQILITVLMQQTNLVEKHKDFIDALRWVEEDSTQQEFISAFPCKINRGVLDSNGNLLPITAKIYVDDILGAAAFRFNMLKLLAAIIEAIFLVCGTPNVLVCQCSLSLEKWYELIVGPKQIILGLVVDMNKMTVGMTNEYIQQCHDLLNLWDQNQRFFKVSNMQKLIGKLTRLGEGAPWIYKLMSHLYTSLAFALKSNAKLCENSSSGFRKYVNQITTKTFLVKQSDHQRHVNYTMKQAAKMINKHNHQYLVNTIMQDELIFNKKALSPGSGIKFKTAIGHLIPWTPTASIIGDSSLLAYGGYSIKLKFWWHLSFPKEIVERTLLYLKDNKDECFISINCLEYFTIIMNYCATLLVFETWKIDNDSHPVVLCVMENTSALN
jgi:hypothetical protein